MAIVPKEEAERNKRALQTILKQSHNKECADCTAKGPTWCAINWGVFICIKCAGIHRKLGVHISKVKSCTLDSWITKDVELVSRVGNRTQKLIYEHAMPAGRSKPMEQDDITEIEKFIRCKYEKRMWMRREFEQGAIAVPVGGLQIDTGSPVDASINSPTTSDASASSPMSPSGTSSPSFGQQQQQQQQQQSSSTVNNQRQRLRLANSANNHIGRSMSAVDVPSVRTLNDRSHDPLAPSSAVTPRTSEDSLLFFESDGGSSNGNWGTASAAPAVQQTSSAGEFNDFFPTPAQPAQQPQHQPMQPIRGSTDDILAMFDQPSRPPAYGYGTGPRPPMGIGHPPPGAYGVPPPGYGAPPAGYGMPPPQHVYPPHQAGGPGPYGGAPYGAMPPQGAVPPYGYNNGAQQMPMGGTGGYGMHPGAQQSPLYNNNNFAPSTGARKW